MSFDYSALRFPEVKLQRLDYWAATRIPPMELGFTCWCILYSQDQRTLEITYPIVHAEGNIVTTLDGNKYELGEIMRVHYLELATYGIRPNAKTLIPDALWEHNVLSKRFWDTIKPMINSAIASRSKAYANAV